ncbi:MAG: chorismate synthase [Bacteroidota bacterium]
MAGNSIGTLFRLTTFGESHGPCIGGVIDGCPAGLSLDMNMLQRQLDRRRPGQSEYTTSRQESDEVEFLSGLLNGKTTGASIGFIIRNKDQRPDDYEPLKDIFRPSHADFTYQAKYGIRDHRGSGRSSARETVARVVAGEVARQLLLRFNIRISAYVYQVGPFHMAEETRFFELDQVDISPIRCPDKELDKAIRDHINSLKESGDTCGGVIACSVIGLPSGIGEPVFDKLSSRLAYAMMGINAAHGFEYGSGFKGAAMRGSEHNDPFIKHPDGSVATSGNNSGGIQGGISNGMPVSFKVAFKPVSTVKMEQETIDNTGQHVTYTAEGRHDACVVPRAVPIVEAMAALTVADLLLQNSNSNLDNLDALRFL